MLPSLVHRDAISQIGLAAWRCGIIQFCVLSNRQRSDHPSDESGKEEALAEHREYVDKVL